MREDTLATEVGGRRYALRGAYFQTIDEFALLSILTHFGVGLQTLVLIMRKF
jgi:hypothetical protein